MKSVILKACNIVPCMSMSDTLFSREYQVIRRRAGVSAVPRVPALRVQGGQKFPGYASKGLHQFTCNSGLGTLEHPCTYLQSVNVGRKCVARLARKM